MNNTYSPTPYNIYHNTPFNYTFNTITLLYFHTMIKIEEINNSTYNFE